MRLLLVHPKMSIAAAVKEKVPERGVVEADRTRFVPRNVEDRVQVRERILDVVRLHGEQFGQRVDGEGRGEHHDAP